MTYTPPEGVTIGSFTVDTLPASFIAPADAVISYKIYGTSEGAGMETESSEPAGYKIPISLTDGISASNYDLFIGSTKLGEDEYLDFVEQKVYKQISGLSEPLCGIESYKDALSLETGAIVRCIGKVVFNGQETWKIASNNDYTYIDSADLGVIPRPMSNTSLYCSHFPNSSVDGMTNGGSWFFRTHGYTSVASNLNTWKQYLADQYTNGTPVTVYYILNTETTETVTVPAGLSGTVEGYLVQEGTPTPTNPIYPTANGEKQSNNTYAIITPTDPPLPLPSIITYDGENKISSTETLGDVEFTGEWTAIMGSTEDESIDIGFTVDAEEYIAFVTVDDDPSIQVFDTITMPASAGSFTLQVVSWGREQYTETVYNALS